MRIGLPLVIVLVVTAINRVAVAGTHFYFIQCACSIRCTEKSVGWLKSCLSVRFPNEECLIQDVGAERLTIEDSVKRQQAY